MCLQTVATLKKNYPSGIRILWGGIKLQAMERMES